MSLGSSTTAGSTKTSSGQAKVTAVGLKTSGGAPTVSKPPLQQVKQTVQFKGKQQLQAGQLQKKTVQKVVGQQPASPGLSAVTAKLSNAGVTLSKPAGCAAAGPARNTPSPARSSALSKDSQLAKKFPHLNITSVPDRAGSPSRPGTAKQQSPAPPAKPTLSVKPNSQLLKPGAPAMTASTATTTASSSVAQKPQDAKSKLALFRAQMKKTLNIHTSPTSKAGPSKPAGPVSAAGKAGQQRPPSRPAGQQQQGGAVRPGQPNKSAPAGQQARPASSPAGAVTAALTRPALVSRPSGAGAPRPGSAGGTGGPRPVNAGGPRPGTVGPTRPGNTATIRPSTASLMKSSAAVSAAKPGGAKPQSEQNKTKAAEVICID